MTCSDVAVTMHLLDMLIKNDNDEYIIRVNKDQCKIYLDSFNAKGYTRVKSECLDWTPVFTTLQSAESYLDMSHETSDHEMLSVGTLQIIGDENDHLLFD